MSFIFRVWQWNHFKHLCSNICCWICDMNKKMSKSIENTYSQAFMTFFNTFENKVVEYCHYAMGYLAMKLSIGTRKLFYLFKMENLHSEHIYKIWSVNDHEMLNICSKYKFPGNAAHNAHWNKMHIETGNVLCGNILNLLWLKITILKITKLKVLFYFTFYFNIFHFDRYNAICIHHRCR